MCSVDEAGVLHLGVWPGLRWPLAGNAGPEASLLGPLGRCGAQVVGGPWLWDWHAAWEGLQVPDSARVQGQHLG